MLSSFSIDAFNLYRNNSARANSPGKYSSIYLASSRFLLHMVKLIFTDDVRPLLYWVPL
jgi:hypothetical protein